MIASISSYSTVTPWGLPALGYIAEGNLQASQEDNQSDSCEYPHFQDEVLLQSSPYALAFCIIM